MKKLIAAILMFAGVALGQQDGKPESTVSLGTAQVLFSKATLAVAQSCRMVGDEIKCWPMVVLAESQFVPDSKEMICKTPVGAAAYPTSTTSCAMVPYFPAHYVYSCADTRRVLLTTESGQHLCVLFPDAEK